MCFGVFLLGFILPGSLCASWTWLTISFPMFGKFSAIISSNIFSGRFSLSCLSGTPRMRMFVCLMLSQRSLMLSSFLFILFSIFWSAALISTFLFSRSIIHSSASVILLLIPSIVLFISGYLFFSYSRSLINIYWIFSIFAFIIFLRLWIIFTIFILTSFSGIFPIFTSFGCFSGILFYPFIWDITSCFFMLINFL